MLLLAGTLAFAGCATKRDLRDVRSQIASLEARQDTIFLALTEQNRAVRDSVFQVLNEVIRTRGDLKNQLLQLEQQLIQIQELSGQTQRRLSELRDDYQRRAQAVQQGVETEAGEGVEPVEGGAGTDPEELYRIGSDQLQRGAASTARVAFEQLLSAFPTHERAPDAQFGIAESLYQDQRYEDAIQAFERLVQLYPDSPRAPQALYRAGVVAEERGNFEDARGYFRRVQSGYPRSEEARLAEQALSRLPR